MLSRPRHEMTDPPLSASTEPNSLLPVIVDTRSIVDIAELILASPALLRLPDCKGPVTACGDRLTSAAEVPPRISSKAKCNAARTCRASVRRAAAVDGDIVFRDTMEGGSLVAVERREHVAIVTLNRPAALNALTVGMIQELAAVFRELKTDATLCCAVLTGAGKAFCAGVDLTAGQSVFQGGYRDPETDPVAQMEACPFPIIGAVNGAAYTGGFELALACDVLVASSSAKFADTHVKFGVMPGWGLSQKLSRLIGANRAREVSFTAQPIDGALAERWGLVSRVVAPSELMPTALSIAASICSNVPDLVRRYKSVLNDGLSLPLGEARQLERDRAADYYSNMTPDQFKAMQDFIQQRSKSQSARSKL
eukprot:jgi/Chlat1/5171/Chrsp33S05034